MRDHFRWRGLNNPYSYRNDNLRQLGFGSYYEYLRSPLWAEIRARVLADGPMCARCAKRKATQVHHRSYDKATLKGESLESLNAVCAKCHRQVERPSDVWQHPYDRLKAAGTMMLERRDPRRTAAKLVRKSILAGTGRPR